MPLYELECQQCGDIIHDIICHYDDIKNIKCEKCGKKKFKNIAFCKSFELKYDPKKDTCGWSWDGYEKSQYYRDVDAANENSTSIVSGPSYSGKKSMYKASNEN